MSMGNLALFILVGVISGLLTICAHRWYKDAKSMRAARGQEILEMRYRMQTMERDIAALITRAQEQHGELAELRQQYYELPSSEKAKT